jgi:hypothetical protein
VQPRRPSWPRFSPFLFAGSLLFRWLRALGRWHRLDQKLRPRAEHSGHRAGGAGDNGGCSAPQATLGEAPDSPAVSLRLEGDPGTTFSGICNVGGKESVLSGRIPKHYAFNPRGQRLSCRIEKRDSGGGNLKVILIAGNTTRSVQQTNTRGSVVNVSYYGN